MKHLSAWISLFASTSTLICCAIPSLLVVLGMGATLAGFIGAFPQIVWLSQYKAYVFIGSGLLISLSGGIHFVNRNAPCPIEPQLALACKRTRKISLILLVFSASLWLLGAFFAFIAPQLF